MAKFTGRSDNLLLFTNGDRGVVVDATFGVVVASGQSELLRKSSSWGNGEFSETDADLARAAFSAMDATVSVPTGRLYTIPKGVQTEAKRALQWMNQHERGGTEVSVVTASLLASGGQIPFEGLRHVSKYFARHDQDKFSDAWEPAKDGTPSAARITWGLWGGDTAQRWASSILKREADKVLTAGGVVTPDLSENLGDPFLDAFNLDPEAGPEFLARVRTDGSGIDRLYKIDIDGAVYVWDDGGWDNLGHLDGDIYTFDKALDDIYDIAGKSHIVIDAASAVIIGARLHKDPFVCVTLEDIDAAESHLAVSAAASIPLDLIDAALVAAAPAPVYDPADPENGAAARSDNASAQLRDGNGRFATMGQRVMIGGNPSSVGQITRVTPADGTVNVQLETGGTVVVPAKTVEGYDGVATAPGAAPTTTRVDTSGILAEPRTPINHIGAQIPGTLPAMTSADLHSMLSDWPAWVRDQRASFVPAPKVGGVPVQKQNSLDLGSDGRAIEEQAETPLILDAYEHPLLAKWLRKTNADGKHPNAIWYQPQFSVTAAGTDAAMTPDNSDVQPIYLAIVAPDDPAAVLELVSIVPASPSSVAPTTFTRKDGVWEPAPKVLTDLQSATPPPVVPLDTATLDTVIDQVDNTQDEQPDPVEATTPAPVTAAPVEAPAAPVPAAAPVVASLTADETLMLLWGPRTDLMTSAVTAAGGLDRNKGGADKLRRYWTVGLGGAKIGWNTPGDWTRCVRHLSKYLGPRSKGYCALRHREMTGMWTGDKNNVLASRFDHTFSTDVVAPESDFLGRTFANARAEAARVRVRGLTASAAAGLDIFGLGDNPHTAFGPIVASGVGPDAPTGSAFLIPLVLPLGVESGDKRKIDINADVQLRHLPLPLLWQFRTASGHDGSVVVGRIDSMEVTPTGVRNARGVFDTGVWGREVERLVRERFIRGVSADMDMFEAQEEAVLSEKDENDGPDKIEKQQIVVHQTRVMAVTIVAKPAFQECEIFLVEELNVIEEEHSMISDGIYVEDVDPLEAQALVAAGYLAEAIPVAPPREWFQSPRLGRSTPITVTEDGHVFGHIATWDTNHMAYNTNLKPPRSQSNYAYFQTGVLRTAEGEDINVGQLTLAGGHAGLEFSAREAVRHYDDTASAIADVRAGEDEFGIWVSGGLRPGTTPEQIRVFRASAPSGDWRSIKGRLEMVAVCQVNVPGFPIARTLVAGGQSFALVAAGASTLAHMQSDPLSEMAVRLEKLEQFTNAELTAKTEPLRQKFAALKAAELSTRMSALQTRVAAYRAEPEAVVETASAFADDSNPLRSRLATFASSQAKAERDRELEKIARSVDPSIVNDDKNRVSSPQTVAPDTRGKYTPDTQPRNNDGKFRLVLARLKDNIGDNANQGIMNKIEKAENLVNAGDYKATSESAADLANTLNRIDTRSMNPQSISTIRAASMELATAVANMPLPFEDQSQKIRFTDLPPVLRELAQSLVTQVQTKLGLKKSAEKVAEFKDFMAGGDFYSQSNVSSQLNKMLNLLRTSDKKD